MPLVQVFVVASQCILAFRQACLVVGILVAAAIVGAVKPTASPSAQSSGEISFALAEPSGLRHVLLADVGQLLE